MRTIKMGFTTRRSDEIKRRESTTSTKEVIQECGHRNIWREKKAQLAMCSIFQHAQQKHKLSTSPGCT